VLLRALLGLQALRGGSVHAVEGSGSIVGKAGDDCAAAIEGGAFGHFTERVIR